MSERVRRMATTQELYVVCARLSQDRRSVVFSEKQRVLALETPTDCSELIPITAQGPMHALAFVPRAGGFHVLQLGGAGPERRFKLLGAVDPASVKSMTPDGLRELLDRLQLDDITRDVVAKRRAA